MLRLGRFGNGIALVTTDRRKDLPPPVTKESLPYPGDSFGTYAVVSTATFAVALFFFGKFYSLDISNYPFLAFTGGGLIVCLSWLLRWQRMKRHKIREK